MTKYTKADIGKVIVPAVEGEEATDFLWRVVEFARSLGYEDTDIDYTEDNYGLGERGFVDNEEWATARVAYGEAIDFIQQEICDKVSFDEINGALVITEHPFIAQHGEEVYEQYFGQVS